MLRTTQHHFIQNSRVLTIQKVTSKKLYWILIRIIEHKQNSQKKTLKKNSDLSLDWVEIYVTPQIVSSNTCSRCFQYKVLSNALFLNKKLFFFQKSNLPLCSFSKKEDETVFYLYFFCPNVRNLWNQLKFHLAGDLMLPLKHCRLLFLAFLRKTIWKI